MTGTEIFLLLVVLLLAVVAAGYFSGLETGSYRLSPLSLRRRLSSGQKQARTTARLLSDPQGLIITTLIGTNLFVYISTAICTALYLRLLPGRNWSSKILSTLTMAPVLFIFAELVPKNLFNRHAEVLVYAFSGSLSLFRKLFLPAVWLLKQVARLWTSLGPARRTGPDPFYTRRRLWYALDQSARQGLLSQQQMAMAVNVMRLRQVTVEQVMVPLDDCVMVSQGTPPGKLKQLGKEGFSHYPVYARQRTNIVGTIHILDVLAPRDEGGTTWAAMRPVVRLPRTFGVEPALTRLRNVRQPLGIVVDNQDRAIGIVTIKDLVEEVVGRFQTG